MIGFNNSVYSYVEKYNAKKKNKSFSVKFGSKIGDFFEIETLLTNEKDIDQLLNENFAGRVVRKDLTKLIKEGANVPVYVLEYLLGIFLER